MSYEARIAELEEEILELEEKIEVYNQKKVLIESQRPSRENDVDEGYSMAKKFESYVERAHCFEQLVCFSAEAYDISLKNKNTNCFTSAKVRVANVIAKCKADIAMKKAEIERLKALIAAEAMRQRMTNHISHFFD